MLISVFTTALPLDASACSPRAREALRPVIEQDQCGFIKDQQIGELFAEPARDLGDGRVSQIYGDRNACDLNSSVIVTDCPTARRLTIGPDINLAVGNGGGSLVDIKYSVAPDGPLQLDAKLVELAGTAATAGHDVIWIDMPWEMPRGLLDWSRVTCACELFYPDSKGAIQ